MAKILLVEDDLPTRDMYQKTLALAGYEIQAAENGQDGLEKLKTFFPDLILLDIRMPVMNGIEMLEKLKSDPATKDLPIIIMTNVTDSETDMEVFAKGANLTIVKSETEPGEVIQWIKTVLEKESIQPADSQLPQSTDTPQADPPQPTMPTDQDQSEDQV